MVPVPPDADERTRYLASLAESAHACDSVYLSKKTLRRFGEATRRFEAQGDPSAALASKIEYGNLLLAAGDVDLAIGELEGAVRTLRAEPKLPRIRLMSGLYDLAVAHFRKGERDNCVENHTAESCILPFAESARHVLKDGAERAAELLIEILEADPSWTEAQWLLNVCHMALGTWPDRVPERYLLKADRLAAEAPFLPFRDVAADLGLNRKTRAGAVILDDFNGDGLIDVVTSSFDRARVVRLFENGGDGAFIDRTEGRGLGHQYAVTNMIQGDVNGDGRLDLLCLRGGGLGADGELPCSLLLQTKAGRFEDKTIEAGIDCMGPSRAAAFADFDQDGDLDVFIGRDTTPLPKPGLFGHESRFYENTGGGRFRDATADAGIRNERPVFGASAGDVDGDGLTDLFLSNGYSDNRLYRNAGGLRFVEITVASGVERPLASGPCSFLDYDQDGDLDLFVGANPEVMHGRAVADFLFHGRVGGETAILYRNDGGGRFENVTVAQGLARVHYALSLVAADLDGDGYPEIHVGTGGDEMAALWPNVLYRNDVGRRFQDVTAAAQMGHLQKCASAAAGDLDGDGDLEVFLQTGGFYLDDAFGDVLFENPSTGTRFLELDLVGTKANRSAIGARVSVTARGPGGVVKRFATITSGGSYGGSPLRVHFGLAAATTIDSVEVIWPSATKSETWKDVPIDRAVRLAEGAKEVETLPVRSFRLGARSR